MNANTEPYWSITKCDDLPVGETFDRVDRPSIEPFSLDAPRSATEDPDAVPAPGARNASPTAPASDA